MHKYPAVRAAAMPLLVYTLSLAAAAAESAPLDRDAELRALAAKSPEEVVRDIEAAKAQAAQRTAAAQTRPSNTVRVQLKEQLQNALLSAPDDAARQQLLVEYQARLKILDASDRLAKRQAK